jgi:hypothetical protein
MATGQYDDAYETPGWTVQNPVYAPSTYEFPSPALPAGVTRATITESFVSANGGMSGSVAFSPTIRRMTIDNVEVFLDPVRAEVRNGQLSVQILSMPQDIVWEVHESIGPIRNSYKVVVPASLTSAELSSLARTDTPTEPAPGFTHYILGVVLGPTDPVPANLAIGTFVFRKTA